jgi:hypothetical protein
LLLWAVAAFPFGLLPAVSHAAEPPEPASVGEAAVLSLPSPVGLLEYRPGRGLRVGSTGLSVGGFTNIKAERDVESGAEFAIDRLNFFLIFDRFTRFRTVAELQLKDIFAADEEGSGAQDFAFDVRRLFGDFTLTDELHIRAGTTLTPVGYWNLILAPPLTWTTEFPLIVEEGFFDPTSTGVMLHGSRGIFDGRLGYSLYTQFLEPIEEDPDIEPADHTAGLRLEYDIGAGRAFGTTYLASEEDGDWSHLGGLHFLWQARRFEILGELLYQDGDDLRADDEEPEPGDEELLIADDEAGVERLSRKQWGTYLQGAFEVRHPFYLVGRYEYFDPRAPDPAFNLLTFGAVYKPFPFMAFKLEYRLPDRGVDESPEGVFFSFTTLF